jgi:ABC-type nitrate/sulfonate/bicarbonate transport system substrate-binding protein
MAPTFSTARKIVTATVTVNTGNQNNPYITDNDIRRVTEDVLRNAARQNGVTLDAVEVTVANGPRTVTLTEEEYTALQQGRHDAA